MKPISFTAFICLLAVACNNGPASSVDEKSDNKSSKIYLYSRIEGVYEGDFGGSGNIRIVLSQVSGSHVRGHSLHKGLRRPISGTISPADYGFSCQLAEPGDNPYDGVFNLKIDTTSFKLAGSWDPVDRNKLSPVAFVLLRTGNLADTATLAGDEVAYIMYDSIGAEYHFEPNGSVSYRFYPDDENQEVTTQQYEEIKGSWRKTATEYIIDWQKNNKFPRSRCIFKIVPNPEMAGKFYLEGEGLKIAPHQEG